MSYLLHTVLIFTLGISPLYALSLKGTVVGISDGDTLTLRDTRQTYKIRLAQIDAPEKSQDFGQASKKHLSDLCYGGEAQVNVQTKDRYNRYVGTVTCQGIEANLMQIKNGMAWVYTQYASDPLYFKAETEARKAKRGLWQQPTPTPPWAYRKKKTTKKAPKNGSPQKQNVPL